MILAFHPEIFEVKDVMIQKSISELLIEFMKMNNHFLDLKDSRSIFFNSNAEYVFDKNEISINHFSPHNKILFKEFLIRKSRVPITGLHIRHLNKLLVGITSGVNPKDALSVFKERSKVIIENSINDWTFVKGVCQKYTSHKQRGSIYKLLNESISKEFIEPDGGGGIGEVVKQTKKWVINDRYSNVYKYKLMALFDSDRTHINDPTSYKTIFEYFKGKKITTLSPIDYICEPTDVVIWHILFKRKLENYVPYVVMKNNIKLTPAQIRDLDLISPSDWDYIEFDVNNIGLGAGNIKDRFPKLFLENFSYVELENRCSHHKLFNHEANENISEFEEVLLKMAKLI